MEEQKPVSYWTQKQAAEIDKLLIPQTGFTINHLMELAGLSVASKDPVPPKFIEKSAEADPFVQFKKWLDEAVVAGLKDPKIMALSTATKDGKPSSRMVLLKKVDKEGFVWCTNYGSRKGCEISENPRAALLFYWNALNRQVRVEGSVQKVCGEESEQFFSSRPRDIQIAPAVSNQSSVVPGPDFLHQQCKEFEEKYPVGSVIPKPEYWGGYRLKPDNFEFWQGQPSRLHDRLRYTPEDVEGLRIWKIDRLSP